MAEAEAPTGVAPGRGRLLASIPHRVLLLIVTLGVNNLAFSYLMIVITAFLPEVGVSTGTIGLVLGAEGLAMAALAIPLGILSDRKGRRWILVLGMAGGAPLFFVVALTRDPMLLIMGGISAGVLEGAYLATVNAMIADQTTVENRDSAFALSFIIGSISGGVGSALPFVIPFLSLALGLSSVVVHVDLLLLFGVVSVIVPAEVWWVLRGLREEPRPGRPWRGVSTSRLLRFSVYNGMIGLGAGFIIPLIPTWLFLRFGLPDTVSGPVLAVASLTIGLAAIFSPRLSKGLGPVRAIALTQGLSVAFMLSLAFLGDAKLALVVYVVRTALMNMSAPIADSFLMGIVDPEERGLASSINAIIWRVPNSVTTIVGGAILAGGDYLIPFLLAGGFYAVGITILYLNFRKTKLTD